jgi:hypothetical protein
MMLRSSVKATFLLFVTIVTQIVSGQTITDEINSIHGNFQIDAQYYNADSLIGAPKVPEKVLSNAFGNLNYNKGKFSAGLRYEAYNNVMQGFDTRYKGQGIVNRFARYQTDILDITLGNIYEQFGSGLIFRTYYEPGLLYDNSLDGVRVISTPKQGLTFKGLIGHQRSFFSLGAGIVRGLDAEINLNELFDSSLHKMKTKFIFGGSFVSKYQQDQNPNFNMPENVAAYGGRLNIIHEGFNFFGEYVKKENDPSADNLRIEDGVSYYTYKPGEAIFISTSYAVKGLSFLLQAKRIDNMGFRSDRDANLQNVLINYLPATTKQHTYLMPAFFPYATQPRGELGRLAELQFKLKKGTVLGGKYGTDVTINYSHASAVRQVGIYDSTSTLKLYTTYWDQMANAKSAGDFFSDFFKDQGQAFYEDFFIEITRKINKTFKLNLLFANQFYNRNMVQFGSPYAGYQNIKSNIMVVDLTTKYASNSAVRVELQGFFSNNKINPNAGSWLTGLIEWTPNSHFFVALLDQYNFDNPDPSLVLHYPLVNAGYMAGPHRISLSIGKQRAGIFCVGGVCRNVPASNGVAISITSSF